MKLSRLILIALTIPAIVGCPEESYKPDSSIRIENQSDEEVVFYFIMQKPKDTLLSSFPYPLTPQNTASRTVKPGSARLLEEAFIRILKEKPDQRLMIYLFSNQVIQEMEWEEIVDGNEVLKRYTLDADDMASGHFKLEYNP